MTAAVAIVRVTLKQLLGARRMIGFGLLGLVPALVMWLASGRTSELRAYTTFQEVALPILLAIVVPVVSLIMGSATLGDERRDGTLSFLVLRPIRRPVITGAKITAAWLATTAIVVPSAALAAAVLGIKASDWSVVVPAMVGAAISALAYVAAFSVLGYVTSRAVLIGLVYVFIWENGITFAAASLSNVSLFRIGLSAYVGLAPESRSVLDEVLGTVTPGLGGAVLKALAVAAVATLLTARLISRGDLTGE